MFPSVFCKSVEPTIRKNTQHLNNLKACDIISPEYDMISHGLFVQYVKMLIFATSYVCETHRSLFYGVAGLFFVALTFVLIPF